jgi:hypothetical protein
MNTPSEVRGVLAQVADGLPRTPDAEGYRRLLTREANHLLPLAHPPSDLRHAINSRRDAQSSINASREQRHENEIRHRLRVAPPELSRQQPQLVARPGDDRDGTSATPLPGTGTMTVDRRTHVEYQRLLRVLGPSTGPQTSRSPTSTSMSLSRT